MKQREKILDKISKLLGLAKSKNVHEASAARGLADRLMVEHDISEADVAEHDPDAGYRELPVGVVDSTWRLTLVTAAARHCGAEAVSLWLGKRRKVRIVGDGASVDAAEILYDGLTGLLHDVDRRVATELRELFVSLSAGFDRREACDAFRSGVVHGLVTLLLRDPSEPEAAVAPKPEEGVIARVAGDFSKVEARYAPSVQEVKLSDVASDELYELGVGVVQAWVVWQDGELKLRSELNIRRTA